MLQCSDDTIIGIAWKWRYFCSNNIKQVSGTRPIAPSYALAFAGRRLESGHVAIYIRVCDQWRYRYQLCLWIEACWRFGEMKPAELCVKWHLIIRIIIVTVVTMWTIRFDSKNQANDSNLGFCFFFFEAIYRFIRLSSGIQSQYPESYIKICKFRADLFKIYNGLAATFCVCEVGAYSTSGDVR